MTDLRRTPLPRTPSGAVSWEALAPWMDMILREIAARGDVRNPLNDFAAGLVATETGVTLGAQALPSGRTVGVPTLFSKIGDAGRAADQRFIWPVTTANRNSVQNISDVLTATSGVATSSIGIASHSVKFDFGTVAYGSGTLTGLTSETVYYVYADDPNYGGGSVTYLATTNPDNLIAQGRYYVGYVATPVTSTSQDITAATSANPIVFTTAAHGWDSGNEVEFADLPGAFAVLNGNTYEVTVIAPTTFSVVVDGSGFAAYVGPAGTATRVTTAYQSGGGAGAGVGGGRFDLVVIP